jgi:predicted lipoprotein
MNKHLRFSFLLLIAVVTGISISSCNNHDTDALSDLSAQNTKILKQYVDSVVIKTYSALADNSILLYNTCVALKNNPTQANVNAACITWKAARKNWEQSEAFLYGAAADYNIDPHIDSWPLDKSQLDLALKNSTLISNMASSGCNFSGFSTLGYGLLGFHAIEYMVFRDGVARNINGGTDSDGNTYNALSTAELVYCTAVAEDLRNQCIRLEASWAGIDQISSDKKTILTDAELEPSLNYGETMIAAGETGNTLYKSQIAAMVQILQGASDISDEVGNTKITDPVNSGNVLDVESWYSWNSLTDFADNIRSVQHAYLGSLSSTASDYSVSAYVKEKNASLDTEIKTTITTAIQAIEASPAPFRNHLTKAETATAVAACNTLMDKLDEAVSLIQK